MEIAIDINGIIVETYKGSEIPSEGLFIYVKPLKKPCLIIGVSLDKKNNKAILQCVE